MALDGSYDGLKATIADFVNRTDLAAVIPDFIRLAEAQMTRRFAGRASQGLPVPRRLIQRADAEIDQGAEYIAAPQDFHGAIDLVLQGERSRVQCQPDRGFQRIAGGSGRSNRDQCHQPRAK